MPAMNFSQHIYNPAAAGPAMAIASAKAAPSSGFSLDDFIDVINPLQHLPVIGTLYRAITGDTIKTPEKIAGDTLYGGLVGFACSVADTAFEAITGKNVGDTVLAAVTDVTGLKLNGLARNPDEPGFSPGERIAALFSHHDTAPVQTAAITPAPVQSVPQEPVQLSGPGASALAASMTRSGIDPDLAQRALYAYQRSNGLISNTNYIPN